MASQRERKKRRVGGLSVTPRVSSPDPRPSSRLCPSFLEVKQRNLEDYPQVHLVQEEGSAGRKKGHLKEGDKQPGRQGD